MIKFRNAFLVICILIMATGVGCTRSTEATEDTGKGLVSFGVWFENEVKSRAATDPKINSIKVSNAKGVVRSYDSLGAVPQAMWLASGDYSVAVDAGETETATFIGAHYSGVSNFVIAAGASQQVNVVCKIDNSLFGVTFADGVKNNLTDYSVKVSVDAQHSLVFNNVNLGEVGYITMPAGVNDVTWNFTAKTKGGADVVKNGTVTNVKGGTRYQLNFNYTTKPTGGLGITVSVDETTEDYEDTFDIYQHPEIKAENFELSQVQQAREEVFTLRATSPSPISSLTATSAVLGGTVNLLTDTGLTDKGIVVNQVSDKEYEVSFNKTFTDALPSGVTNVTMMVVDTKANSASVAFSFLHAGMNAVSASDVWATRFPVSAQMPQMTKTVQFGYKPSGSSTWEYANASYSGGKYMTTLTGLTPSTQYDVQLFVGGTATGGVIQVTTEGVAQLSNSNFENWYQDTAWFPYSSGGEAIWATGNPGATTLGASWNLTTPNSDVRPGSTGSKSANMQSMYPNAMGIGKFAAGNLFVGRYVGTNGTNGVVEFGKPFTCRPTALRGWYKCNVGTVDKAPSGSPVSKGDADRYQIYVCLMTGSHQVDTSNKSTFFNPATDESVLAYAVMSGSTSVSDWTQFTLTLKYKDTVTRPQYIAVVATCSAYGDYFAGSTSSWMRVDDFELVY